MRSDWSDPTWSASGSAWALNIANSGDVFTYGAGLYSFFQNYAQTCQNAVTCQNSLALVDTASTLTYIHGLNTIGATTMLTVGGTNVVAQKDNINGFALTMSVWSSSSSAPGVPPPTPVGCPSLQSNVSASFDSLNLLYDDTCPCIDGSCPPSPNVCGFFGKPGSLTVQEWTNVNSFETMYNTVWQSGIPDYNLVETQDIVPAKKNALGAGSGWAKSLFTSLDDAGWAGLMYVKVQQYNDAHGINPGDQFYNNRAVDIWTLMQQNQLGPTTPCGNGMPQIAGGTAPNTISTQLWISLSSALAVQFPSNKTYANAATAGLDWITTGKGKVLRDKDGLYMDGGAPDCSNGGGTKWTYNQGPILSALGTMATINNNPAYIGWGVGTLDSIQAATTFSTTDLSYVNRTLKEKCDDPKHQTCDHDQVYFKGVFMKHLQYFLDNCNNTIRDRYSDFVGLQASAVIHFATKANNSTGSVWYTPDLGGSEYDYKTQTAGLDALNCAVKYATC